MIKKDGAGEDQDWAGRVHTFQAEVPVLESVVGRPELVATGSQEAEEDEEEKEEKDLHVRNLIHGGTLM